MKMKKICLSFLFLTFVTIALTDVLLAQYGEEYCLITLKGQNRNRTVAGAINEECGSPVQVLRPTPFEHDPPFGNWGVASNYGDIKDADQFRGWKRKGGPSTKRQWNSCTTEEPAYRPPTRDYYNANNYTTQASPDVVTHGVLQYRSNVRTCPPPWWPTPPSTFSGCRGAGGLMSQSSNFMTLYELDGTLIQTDRHDLIETLYFPGTSVTLTNCTKEGCPEKTTGWMRMTSSTDSTKIIEAELRMKASASVQGACDWSWTGGGG